MQRADAPSIDATWRSARGIAFGHQESAIDILAHIGDLTFTEYMAPGRHLPTFHSIRDGSMELFTTNGAPCLCIDEISRFRKDEIRPRAIAVAVGAVTRCAIPGVKRPSRIEIPARCYRRRSYLRRRVSLRCRVSLIDAGLHELLANVVNDGKRLRFRQSCTPSGHRRARTSVENGFQHALARQQGCRLGAREIARRRNQSLTCPRKTVAAVTMTDRAILMVELSGFRFFGPCNARAQTSEGKRGQAEMKTESEGVHWIGVDRVVDRMEDWVI